MIREIWNAIRGEQRTSLENPSISLSSPQAFSIIFGDAFKSATGIEVTVERALGVPALWAASNFISSTVASLPLQLFKTDTSGKRDLARSDPLYSLLHDVVNDDFVTSFKWRKQTMMSVLTQGRSFTYIERNKAMRPMNLWPLDPKTVTVERKDLRTRYHVQDGERKITYEAGEILDIPFMLLCDGVKHASPIATLKNAIGLAIAMEEYASRFFQNGGIPPLALNAPMASPGAIRRATAAIDDAARQAISEGRNVLYMPEGHELKPIGFKPEDGQLNDARLFQLREIARIYSIPPSFLQDLQFGTFSNTEQQDLHFVKHTLVQWLELWEQELNAKLFGARNTTRFVEFNVDGLLRGDFSTRMNGYAQAVQNAILAPDEIRGLENWPAKGGKAAQLLVNSTLTPIENAGEPQEPVQQELPLDQPEEGGQDDGEPE